MMFLEQLKPLDLFGVFFDFRMENYSKYQSKTGAMVFLGYILVSLIISLLFIYEFFNITKNYTESQYEELAINDSINFINQNFTIALKLPDYTKFNVSDDFLIVDAIYKYSDSFKPDLRRKYSIIQNLTKIKCKRDDFTNNKYTEIFSFDEKTLCFDFKDLHKINGHYYYHNFSYVEISINLNTTYKKALRKNFLTSQESFIDIIYPMNILKEYVSYENFEKIINNVNVRFQHQQKVSTDIFLMNNIYKESLDMFQDIPRIFKYLSFQEQHNYLYYQNSDDNGDKSNKIEIGKIYFRQYFKQKVYLKTRIKIFALISKISGLFINLFLVCRTIMILVNLKKAKKFVIEKIFQINHKMSNEHFENEEYSQNKNLNLKNIIGNCNSISGLNNQDVDYRFDLNMNQKDNKNSLKEIEFVDVQLEIIKKNKENLEVKDDKIENINTNKSNLISFDFPNQKSKDLKKKMLDDVDINKNTSKMVNKSFKHSNQSPSIKRNISFKTKLNNKLNLRYYLYMIICCKFREMNKLRKMYHHAENRFDYFLNIANYIKKMQEIETIKKVLFDIEGEYFFNFLSRPIINVKEHNVDLNRNIKNHKYKSEESEFDDEIITNYYYLYKQKYDAKDTEKKLLELAEKYYNEYFIQ